MGLVVVERAQDHVAEIEELARHRPLEVARQPVHVRRGHAASTAAAANGLFNMANLQKKKYYIL